MGKCVDLTGQVFGRLKVLERVENDKNGCARWLCECSCAEHNKVIMLGTTLRKGKAKSCGCLKKEAAAVAVRKAQQANKKYNEYRFDGDVVIGKAHNSQMEFYVDLEDFDLIKDHCWSTYDRGSMVILRAYDQNTKKVILMHDLLGCKNYDHINRNELDNRRCNLRPATQQQNTMNRTVQRNNTSGVTGVTYRKDTDKWIARINVDGKRKQVGQFAADKFEDAVRARLMAEAKYYQEFAPQQHLYEQYGINNAK